MITARSQYDERLPMDSDISFKGDKGVTKIADAKDCDINELFRRFEKTGQLPNLIARNGRYGDFSAVPDYQEACNIVNHANEQFAALDVSIRNRFENNPAKFLEFATNDKNIDELEKMGLLKPEVVEARKQARIAASAQLAAADKAKAELAEKDLIAKVKAAIQQG